MTELSMLARFPQLIGCLAMAACLLPLVLAAEPSMRVPAVETRIERDFGYVMGEILLQTIRVETDVSAVLDESMLPQPGSALSDWLEVRDIQWRQEHRGDRVTVSILVTYQIFKGVRDAERLAIPALPLRFRVGGETVEAAAPALPFTVSPLIPAGTPDDSVHIRSAKLPTPRSATSHGLRLALSLGGLFGLLFYAAWRLGQLPFAKRNVRPFAIAFAELKKLRRSPPSSETFRTGLRLFHSAINQYARKTVLEGQLPQLFRENPELASIRNELEALFAFSHRVFFSAPDDAAPTDFSLNHLEALCRRCRAIERGRP